MNLIRLLLVALLCAPTGAFAIYNIPDITLVPSGFVECTDGNTTRSYYRDCGDGWSLVGQTLPIAVDVHLAFSDLISGPDTGLGDGSGSGVIVTVWGFGLGATQGDSTIEFCDNSSVCRSGHVYYWKDADGQLPSGPANLYESHGMQEIAFSIPDSAQGAGTIRVTVDGNASSLPFTVRPGSIYHVKSTGNDSTGDGSWGNPWATWNSGAKANLDEPGATIYFDSVFLGGYTSDQVLHFNKVSLSSSLASQFMLVGYPNTRPEVAGYRGTTLYNDPVGFGVSKFSFFSANYTEVANGQLGSLLAGALNNQTIAISGVSNGRITGNYVTDWHPSNPTKTCATGTQGAIKANSLYDDEISNLFVLGNMIEEYGCYGSNKLHHTTYFSIRSAEADEQLVAPTVSYNYLKNNHTKNGLHFYDENNTGDECGDFTTTFKFTDNVVVNQAGSGIEITAACNQTGDFLVENNVFINVGLAADWDGQSVATSNGPNTSGISIEGGSWQSGSSITVRNNSVYKWNDDDNASDTEACIGWGTTTTAATYVVEDNLCWTDKDKPFSDVACCGAAVPTASLTMDGNVFYTSVGSPSNAVVPGYATNSITSDPLITLAGSKLLAGNGSSIAGQSSTTLARDIYGVTRGPVSSVGAVQAASSNEVAGIIFETNFANDAGYSKTGESYFDFVDVPEGWDGVRTNAGTIEGVAGEGVGGSVAMRFTWPQGNGQILANSLFKHLTDDENTGYEELYIRYNIRLPNNFKAGEGGEALPFWKWGRLWQNTGLAGSGWTENRTDSYYIVWNWSPGLPQYGIRNNFTFGENLNTNSLGSAGGPRAGTDWYTGAGVNSDNIDAHIGVAGNWDNVGAGAWRFDHSTRFLANNTAQSWHTIEWRFRLSTTATANNGVFQVWFDGVEQVHPNVIDGIDQTIDQPSTTNSLVTAALPGFNFFTLFDNMAEWSSDQPTVIYINDVVISTNRIGHDYVAGSVQ